VCSVSIVHACDRLDGTHPELIVSVTVSLQGYLHVEICTCLSGFQCIPCRLRLVHMGHIHGLFLVGEMTLEQPCIRTF
jgi:hypothetical protein